MVSFVLDQVHFAIGDACIGILLQIIRFKTKKNNRSSSQSNDLGLEFYMFSKGLYDYT